MAGNLMKQLIVFLSVVLPIQILSLSSAHALTCQEYPTDLVTKCSQNPEMLTAQETIGMKNMMQQQGQALANANSNMSNTQASQIAVMNIQKTCEAYTKTCVDTCNAEIKQSEARIQAAQGVPGAQGIIQTETANITNNQTVLGQCEAEAAKTAAATGMMMGELAMMVQALAALIAALGGTPSGDVTGIPEQEDDEDDDECSGEYAEFLAKCKDKTETASTGTRGGLAGVGAPTGGSGGGSFFGPGSEADTSGIGGESKGNGSGAAGAGGFGGGLGGGGGFGDTSGGSGSGSGAGGEGLDTDLGSGFHAAGGGGGGGGFGGGGGAPRAAGFGGSGGSGAGKLAGKGALQSKLNKFAKGKGPKRGLASKGGANGPFDDNWKVITQSYKKNSSTMYHQP